MHTRGTYDGDIGLRCHYAVGLCVLMVVELERIMDLGAFFLRSRSVDEKRGGGVGEGGQLLKFNDKDPRNGC